ncbi:MAG: acetoin utilization protein AcuC [Thermoplasmata archaeon]
MGPDCSLSVFWDPKFLQYEFGSDHPFTERSRWMAVRLLDDTGFFGGPAPGAPQWVENVSVATREELGRFHASEYLDLVNRLGRSRSSHPLDAGDTPSFPGCFEAAAALSGGTLAGAREVRDFPARHAFNPGGGLHHAHPNRASGFCIFNDLAVAIRALQEESPTLSRIAYIDIDVHHGDGVMYGFYDDGRLLDIDFHQDGRTIFPGTGFPSETGRGDGVGLKVNVPLPPETGDEAFIPLFEQIVPTMVRTYRPEMIVVQCGMDAHVGDRLGSLQYTPAAYERAVDLVHSLSHEVCGGRLLLTGGGGYAPENVSRGLARVAARLARSWGTRVIGQPLPSEWREEFERDFHYPAPRGWDEGISPEPSPWTADRSEKLLTSLGERLGVRWDRSEVTWGGEPGAPG